MFNTLADDKQFAFEVVGGCAVITAADEHLADDRFNLLDAVTEVVIVSRDITPAQQDLAFFNQRLFDQCFALVTTLDRLRQKHHANAIMFRSGQFDAEINTAGAQEIIRYLNQYAGTIPGFRVCTNSAAMGQVFQDGETLTHYLMAFTSFEIGHEANTAGIVFIGRVVQALSCRQRASRHQKHLYLQYVIAFNMLVWRGRLWQQEPGPKGQTV